MQSKRTISLDNTPRWRHSLLAKSAAPVATQFQQCSDAMSGDAVGRPAGARVAAAAAVVRVRVGVDLAAVGLFIPVAVEIAGRTTAGAHACRAAVARFIVMRAGHSAATAVGL